MTGYADQRSGTPLQAGTARDAAATRLDRPVFLIGMGRSGSTVIYEAFSAHEDLGWLSNYSRIAPGCPALNFIVKLVDNRWWFLRGAKRQGQSMHRFKRLLPRPDEAYPAWERCAGGKFRHSFLRGVTASEGESRRLRQLLGRTLAAQGKTRFVGKLTGPPRIEYLSSVFPDALFIHIVRDGRAVVHSLLNVAFWRDKGGLDGPAWDGGLEEADLETWRAADRDPVVLAALQWCRVIDVARHEKAQLEGRQYRETRYEDFVARPVDVLAGLFDHCGLAPSDRAHSYVMRRAALRNMNDRYRVLSRSVISKMETVMGEHLADFGYV